MESVEQLEQEGLAWLAVWRKQNLATILEIAKGNAPHARELVVSLIDDQAGIESMARWLKANAALILSLANSNNARSDGSRGEQLTVSPELFDQALAAVNRWHEAYMRDILALAGANPFSQSAGQNDAGDRVLAGGARS